MARDLYLGYRNDDAKTPFGKFFKPEMAPLPPHVVEALQHGPQAGPTLLSFEDAASIANQGYQQTENGYGMLNDGSMQVSVRTDMPAVTPAMWTWWFGWHGSDSRRYKLWHPRAHLSARWRDGDDAGRKGEQRYIGRCSMISEYIGSTMLNAAIQFVTPTMMGLPGDSDDAVSICARLGSGDVPVDAGWFVHQVRSTQGGAEMRSRLDGRTTHRGAQRPWRGFAGGASHRVAGSWHLGSHRSQSAGALRAGDESPGGFFARAL